ncbi:hypothetical protein F5Y04DRAFT_238591 [Hypomontagnella monticulosa]|nr:hypothetical protein F5Y04DRAFT_238591 [Hypomontagnella monticulosa]
MESRGNPIDDRPKARLAITRRSCDQCRARKIGCNRGSPCSNCVSARVNCTHSAVASNATTPKQRVLISAQYEQKIDDIAKGIDGIKLLLQGLNVSSGTEQLESSSLQRLNEADPAKHLIEHNTNPGCGVASLWDHSFHIIDFVKAVVEDRDPKDVGPEESEVLSSLRRLVQTLEDPPTLRNSSIPELKIAKYHVGPSMPPLEAVVAVLRWAKEHEGYNRLIWVSQMLPLEKFADICRKVYFAVDDYSEIDFIIANGYLSYIFVEHAVISGRRDYQDYSRLCSSNTYSALLRLPLLLPASMETIAALTLGAFKAIENSKAIMSWTFISAASDLCQRLGYHRLRSPRETDHPMRDAQERLFWNVHKIDKSLSLRLGRPSNIRDAEITLPIKPDEPRATRLARIQGKVYDQLYSPAGLSRPSNERGPIVEALATELRGLIDEAHDEIADVSNQLDSGDSDPTRIIYLQCDLVCQSSLLALILRAIPAGASLTGVSDDCVTVARETLDIHHQCMTGVRKGKGDPSLLTKYINWAILHTPFVPFGILFTRSVQLLDAADLVRLERFAASLQPETASSESITHPYRLYELLCQTARLYIDSHTFSSPTDVTDLPDSVGQFDFVQFGMDAGVTLDGALDIPDFQADELSDWYYGNQQLMNLLDDDARF